MIIFVATITLFLFIKLQQKDRLFYADLYKRFSDVNTI